jgi:hypothetical protein
MPLREIEHPSNISSLLVFPQLHCPPDVCLLCSLVAAAQQDHGRTILHCVVHAIADVHVHAQFPDAIAAEDVIAEISRDDTIQMPKDRDAGALVAQSVLWWKYSLLPNAGTVMSRIKA